MGTMTCGRRSDTFGINAGAGNEDTYRVRDGAERCSYCGSLSPEALFAAIAAGAELGPTDKNYKVYVKAEGIGFAKFYFQHLDEDGRKRFIDLLNAGKITIGAPGYFYRLPYFVVPA